MSLPDGQSEAPPRSKTLAIGIILALVVAAMLSAYWMLRRTSGKPGGSGESAESAPKTLLKKEALAALNLGKSPEELARAGSGENTSDGVVIHIDSPKFESVWFGFDQDHRDHPISF